MGAEQLDTVLRPRSALERGSVEERMELSGLLRGSGGEEGFVKVKKFSLRDGQFVVQDIEELPLHPSNIPHSENPSGVGPTDVPERRIVGILQGQKQL